MNLKIRDLEETDLPFVYSTWLRGVYYGNSWLRQIDQDIFFRKYHKVLEVIIWRSQVKVACLEEEPDVVLGYAVYEGETLHWVFVKKAWRKLEIASKLVPKKISRITHITKLGKSLKDKEWVFDPFLWE